MKKILVLTDFSVNARHAATEAAGLAVRMHADLLLFHAVNHSAMLPVMIEPAWETPGPLTMGDSCVKKLSELAGALRLHVEETTVKGHQPEVFCICGTGNLGSNVRTLCMEYRPALVVCGGSTGSSTSHLFFGSNVFSVLEHCPSPLLIIHSGATVQEVRRISFATNLETAEEAALRQLADWSKFFGSDVYLLHVRQSAQVAAGEQQQAEHLKSLLERRHITCIFRQRYGHLVADRLWLMCRETSTDLLALVHRHGGLLSRLSRKSLTRHATSIQRIPLFIFPR